jgi:hypothetical protein
MGPAGAVGAGLRSRIAVLSASDESMAFHLVAV